MIMARKNRYILCISDTHVPYHHPDTIKFLKAVKNEYPIDRVVHLGDEVDHAAINFHDKDPDSLFTPKTELDTSIQYMHEFYDLFPKVDVMESNHGSMVYRRQKYSGLSRSVFKSYNEILEAPNGWVWHKDLVIVMSNGQECYFCHGMSANVLKASQDMAMNVVQGHYHTKFRIDYWSNPNNLYWGMNVGCSIDDKDLMFAYNKVIIKRPIIGHAIIIEGIPKLLPMVLNKKGRWIGRLP
jgi:hypothetical protein